MQKVKLFSASSGTELTDKMDAFLAAGNICVAVSYSFTSGGFEGCIYQALLVYARDMR